MGDVEAVLEHLSTVDRATAHHALVRRQAIKDAYASGATVTEIAATLGVRNRAGVYDALRADAELPAALDQLPTPAVFLRAPGASSDDWRTLTAAIQARGWWPVRDRSQAWHLARGRVPVVMVDFAGEVTVGRVKARFDEGGEPHLPLDGPRTTLPQIPTAGGLDTQAIALAVIDHLQHPRGRRTTPPPSAPGRTPEDPAVEPIPPSPGVTRPIFLADELWERLPVDADSSLLAQAVSDRIVELERQHNDGRPFPSVDRLPTGPRTRPASRLAGSQKQVRLPAAVWERARAVVAAGVAPSLPALIAAALQSWMDSA